MGFFLSLDLHSRSLMCRFNCLFMKILVGCEISGTIQEILLSLGHDAVSCDIQKPNHSMPFLHGDINRFLSAGWDALIAFPPCQFLTKAQIHMLYKSPGRMQKSDEAVKFVRKLYDSDIQQVILENPPGRLSTEWRYSDQLIRPCYFGDPYHKEVCLWLKNSPPIMSTCFNPNTMSLDNHTNGRMSSAERSNIRSSWKFFPHMAYQICLQSFGDISK